MRTGVYVLLCIVQGPCTVAPRLTAAPQNLGEAHAEGLGKFLTVTGGPHQSTMRLPYLGLGHLFGLLAALAGNQNVATHQRLQSCLIVSLRSLLLDDTALVRGSGARGPAAARGGAPEPQHNVAQPMDR